MNAPEYPSDEVRQAAEYQIRTCYVIDSPECDLFLLLHLYHHHGISVDEQSPPPSKHAPAEISHRRKRTLRPTPHVRERVLRANRFASELMEIEGGWSCLYARPLCLHDDALTYAFFYPNYSENMRRRSSAADRGHAYPTYASPALTPFRPLHAERKMCVKIKVPGKHLSHLFQHRPRTNVPS